MIRTQLPGDSFMYPLALRHLSPFPGDTVSFDPMSLDPVPGGLRAPLGQILLDAGALEPEALSIVLDRQRERAAPLGAILLSQGAVDETSLYDALAQQFDTRRMDLAGRTPERTLIDRLGADFCLVHGLLPLARAGAASLLVTCHPERFDMLRAVVEERIGPVMMAVATQTDLRTALLNGRQRHLAGRAERRTEAWKSCRSLSWARLTLAGGGLMVGVCAALWFLPSFALSALILLALVALIANTAFAATAAVIHLRQSRVVASPVARQTPLRATTVSILVPLFHERHIAQHLIARLARLDYPHDMLEILLLIEEDDSVTRDTLAMIDLPPHMQVVVVPRGHVQTKPRAMNYALDFCNGTIVGVYDAEDDPEPDQITSMVRQFQHSPPQVACLQGRLDFYNPHQNWMARCFTLDYAVWFRVMLPCLAHLGLVIPLGGTTLFFRRAALVSLGGWDAHNVTEDADLGVRLARHGYRTDLLDSTTYEEANCHPWAWVRQRSRWIKGYGVTYLVHMRQPLALWRDLGARRFFGVQLLFLGSMLGVALAPFLWAFALLWLGLPHPWADALGPRATAALTTLLFGGMLIQWFAACLGLRDRRSLSMLPWVPVMSLYSTLATLAWVKAAIELVVCPFFWDKTSHGISPVPQTLDTINVRTARPQP